MWKNVVETKRPQMTPQYGAYALRAGLVRLYARLRMHALKHARTHRPINNTSFFITATMIRQRASLLC